MIRRRVLTSHTKVLAAGVVAGVLLATFARDHLGSALPTLVIGVVGGGVLVYSFILLRGRVGAKNGFATSLHLSRSMSTGAARRSARVTRPSIANPRRVPIQGCGIRLGTSRRPLGRRAIYAAHEDVVVAVGPPRMGKTALFGNAVIDAPGAVVCTSTKIDLHRETVGLRAQRGPVYVLNPEAMGDVESDLRWSPIAGCDEPQVAIERAAYMVAGSPSSGDSEDQKFWENSNAKVLRCYLYAAAVGSRSMADLRDWVNDPDDREALHILEHHLLTPPGWAEALRQVLTTPAEKTRESIFLTLQLTFEFMADPAVAQAVLPAEDDVVFDARRFISEGASLYLLGAHKTHGGMGPLFSALTGHIFEEAKRLSQSLDYPAGRLDPPLTMVLDEATNICSVPLAQWTSDAGGRGIPLLIAIQSRSQLRERWGEAAAETVWNNANVTIAFGGIKLDKDLAALSELCGERDEKVYTFTTGSGGERSRSQTVRRVPVMAPSEIRQIGTLQILVLHRNTRPILAKVHPVWERRDVKALARTKPNHVTTRPAVFMKRLQGSPGMAKVIPFRRSRRLSPSKNAGLAAATTATGE